jgi:hypothetical protein
MRPLIELPAERDLQHLPADDADDPAECVKPEIPVTKRRVGVV